MGVPWCQFSPLQERIMFRDSLIESSSRRDRRKRWPMALAFMLESIAACLIVLVPLLTTGVIPAGAAHIPPIITPIHRVRIAEIAHATPRPGSSAPPVPIVVLADNPNRLY